MQINMEEALVAVPDYKTFNEWFFRKLKPEVQSLLQQKSTNADCFTSTKVQVLSTRHATNGSLLH